MPLSHTWALAVLDSITEGVLAVDQQWRITYFNRAAERITGLQGSEVVGQPCWEVLRSNLCDNSCPLAATLKQGQEVKQRIAYIVTAEGRQKPICLSTALVQDEKGHILGGVELFRHLEPPSSQAPSAYKTVQMGEMVSCTPRMQQLFQLLPRVAESESAVLLQGESGTGKELVARALHQYSRRRQGPFVAVNCGAIPDNLLEAEFFGYKAGAFTDARRNKPGRFAQAHGGTLFLDEIGDISPALQLRLLRVLQEQQYEPLGATQTEQADVRIIAATHRDLAAEVAQGGFREDLYYRLNVVRLQLPPLRERPEDIPLLTERLLLRLQRRTGRRVEGVLPETLKILKQYSWPGNIRELENALEHAMVLCDGQWLAPEHLPSGLQPHGSPVAAPQDQTLAQVEKAHILKVLAEQQGNRSRAARVLGIHKTTLLRKLKAFQL